MTSWSLFLSCSLVLTGLQSVIGESCTYFGDYGSLAVSTVTCSDHAPGLYSNSAWGYNSGTKISSVSQIHNGGKLYATAWSSVTGDGDSGHCLHCLQISYGGKSVKATVIDKKGASGVDLSADAFDCLFGSGAHVGGGNFGVTVTDLGAGPCSGGGGCSTGGGSPPTTTKSTTKTPTTTKKGSPPSGTCKKYTVQAGDTGWGIATKLGLNFNTQLSVWNPNVVWTSLSIGQQICVSAGTAAETTTSGVSNDTQKWLIPLLVIIAILFVTLLVIIFRNSKQRGRSYSSEIAMQDRATSPRSETGTQTAKPVWEKRTDPTSGTTCYYNTATGQTQWEAPDELNTSPTSV